MRLEDIGGILVLVFLFAIIAGGIEFLGRIFGWWL